MNICSSTVVVGTIVLDVPRQRRSVGRKSLILSLRLGVAHRHGHRHDSTEHEHE